MKKKPTQQNLGVHIFLIFLIFFYFFHQRETIFCDWKVGDGEKEEREREPSRVASVAFNLPRRARARKKNQHNKTLGCIVK